MFEYIVSVRKFLLGIVDNDEDDGGDRPGTPLNSFSFDEDGKDVCIGLSHMTYYSKYLNRNCCKYSVMCLSSLLRAIMGSIFLFMCVCMYLRI